MEQNGPIEFNRQMVFEKLKPIVELSKALLESIELELTRHDQNLDAIRLSECLDKAVEPMKTAYAQYMRNHEEIGSQLKKVRSANFEEKINH